MSEISEDVNPKSEIKFPLKLKQSLDSSNNSNEEIFFSSNYLINHSEYMSRTNQNKINKSNTIFDLDLEFKKKLFCSEINQKSDNKKNSDALSTEPTSIRVKNFNSPKKKRFSVIKLIEKDKKNKKEMSKFAVKKEEKEISPEKKERTDIYGNVINKKNKKRVKVSFIDKVTTQPLVNTVDIECFKNYNYVNGIPKEEKIEKKTICECCIIF